MGQTLENKNKVIVLEAFNTLFNSRLVPVSGRAPKQIQFCLDVLFTNFAFCVSYREENVMPQVSFERDIRPLFRDVDISHMEAHGITLDDYTFMSDPDNANKVLETLSPHEGDPPSMPPGGPYWTADQLALFAQWQNEGYQP